jgi:hypothetical protein
MFEFGSAINKLRNTEGTGHGRPWLAGVTDLEDRLAIESHEVHRGIIAFGRQSSPLKK